MARARMLHRSIAIDARFNELSIKEQWVFMRLLPFADDEGKLTGNITEISALTLPLAPVRNTELEKLLIGIQKSGLLYWNQDEVIQYKGWSKNQKIGHRPAKSILTDIDPDKVFYVEEEESEKKVKKATGSNPNFSKDEMVEFGRLFPEKDTKKCHDMWLDYLKSTGNKYKDYKAAFRNVLRRDWSPNKNGNGIKTSRFKRAPSGSIIAYCIKCDSQLFFDHEWQAEKASHCGRGLTGRKKNG